MTDLHNEMALRVLYQKLLSAWAAGDAQQYASLFTEDADYIIATGLHEKGRAEIAAGHEQIFTTWAKGSHLFGELRSIRFLAHDFALLIAQGSILMPGQSAPDDDEMTIYSLIAQEHDGQWQFAAYQNTPIQA